MSFSKGISLPLSTFRSPSFFSIPLNYISLRSRLDKRDARSTFLPISHSFAARALGLRNPRVYAESTETDRYMEKETVPGELEGDLAADGAVFQSTLRLVECSMFAAVAGLAYFLSNSLAIENYFGCFFSLPIVISSMRWGVAGGRKTMVATAMLLLTLSGPVKAATYLLMHGLVGLAMGSLWRLRASWGLSITLCTLVLLNPCFLNSVRALGAMGYVLITSFLIRENILALITINLHASLTYILAAVGISAVPSMDVIYAVFGFVAPVQKLIATFEVAQRHPNSLRCLMSQKLCFLLFLSSSSSLRHGIWII